MCDNSEDSPKKKLPKIDGTIVLQVQDAVRDTPLYLAAQNHESFEILELLMKHGAEVAMFPNNKGNLSLHLCMIRIFFLWMLTSLTFMVPKTARKMFLMLSLPLNLEKDYGPCKEADYCAWVKNYLLCGAIFAPTNGWTSEDDEDVLQTSLDMMKKIHFPWNSTCEA